MLILVAILGTIGFVPMVTEVIDRITDVVYFQDLESVLWAVLFTVLMAVYALICVALWCFALAWLKVPDAETMSLIEALEIIRASGN